MAAIVNIGAGTRLGAPPAPRVRRQRSKPTRAIANKQSRGSRSIVAKATGSDSDTVDPRRAMTASLAALVVATAGSSGLVAFAEDAPLLTDYVSDTKDLIQKQRDLLREGKGDVDSYYAKAEAYFAGYKWDHKGHTNSFSQLMNTDIIIRTQDEYLKQTGGSWSKDSVPPSGTPKAKILEGYLQNADRCITKESMGKFNEMDLATREEWKAIVCTQGLVAPADDL